MSVIDKTARFNNYGNEAFDEGANEVQPINTAQLIEIHDQEITEQESITEKENDLREVTESSEEVENVTETLEALIESIQGVLATGTANKQVTGILSNQINASLKTYGVENFAVSIEGYDNDNVAYLTASVEGLKDIISRIVQGEVIRIKRVIDISRDMFKSFQTSAARYKVQLQSTEALLKQKAAELKSKELTVSAAGTYPYFSDYTYFYNNPTSKIKPDVEVSTYILTKHVKAVKSELDKLINIITNGDLSNFETFTKTIINKCMSLKLPADMFDKKYLVNDGGYFCGSKFQIVEAKYGKVKSENPDILKFRNFCDPKVVKLVKSKINMVNGSITVSPIYPVIAGALLGPVGVIGVGAGQVAGNILVSMKADEQAITVDELQTIIKAGKDYCDNVIKEVDVFSIYDHVDTAWIKLQDKLADKAVTPEVKDGIKLVILLMDIYLDNLFSPMLDEERRSVKMARACNYLATSVIK